MTNVAAVIAVTGSGPLARAPEVWYDSGPLSSLRRFLGASLLTASLLLTASGSAEAGEFQLDAALNVKASTWRGDFGAGPQLRFGYRFGEIFAIDAAVWEEILGVDARLNTGLTLGVSGFLRFDSFRSSLRLFFIHQHEEALVSVADNPFGALFGIGSGIRHRAGGGGALGLEIPFDKGESFELVFVSNFNFTVFAEDVLGPRAYFGITGGVGFNYSLPGLP